MTTLYFDCFSGAAGDMILGALLDAGAPESAIRASLDALELPGWELSVEEVTKGALRATQVSITASDPSESRSYGRIKELIQDAPLRRRVQERALRAFRALAEAEGKIHGIEPDEVHFHEVGSVDAIVDIVGCAAAIDHFDPARIVTSPVATGRGWTESAHGPLPVPAPATLELMRGAPLEQRGDQELITPTGAAILAAVTDRYGDMPRFRVQATGYGAGRRELEWPNVVRVVVGTDDPASSIDHAWLIETNIDDMNPELIPNAIESLIGAGASDAWTSAIVMKKGRPAFTLSVLTKEAARESVLDVVYRETTTLGVRLQKVEKDELEREWVNVEVSDQKIRVKLGLRGREIVSISPEYEDALVAARAAGVPLREIYDKALAEATAALKKRF